MRNKRDTIESLRRLAERPGTQAEGETARRLLAKMLGNRPNLRPFQIADFRRGTHIFYNKWAYQPNAKGVVIGKDLKIVRGRVWLRIQFEHLKTARWVPVTSNLGCHVSKTPLADLDAEYLSEGMVRLASLRHIEKS